MISAVQIPSAAGYRHVALQSVGSTMVEAREWARSGDLGNLWITATEQLSGKARRGREWVSKPGNLYSSLLLIDPAEGNELATLPLVISVALYDAIASVAPALKEILAIKWPNDILVQGKKVSGILMEASVLPDDRRAVIIGCGVNCEHFPENPLYPATSLHAEGAKVSSDHLFSAFAESMADALETWNGGTGFASIRQRWLSVAKGLGEPITARFSDYEIAGTFKELDADGLLVLVDNSGKEHRIAAADIFFGNLSG